MTEKLSGTTGEEVEAAVLTVEGFTFDEDNPANVLKGTIAADGSLELKVYYTRNSYKLTWIIDSLKMDVSYKFGETVNKLSDPVKEGYTFTGWTPEIVFLEADTAEIMRRYATTRRPHPLESEGVGLEDLGLVLGMDGTEPVAVRAEHAVPALVEQGLGLLLVLRRENLKKPLRLGLLVLVPLLAFHA